jgi:hypothetical protein
MADEILKLCRTADAGFQDRAALLKAMKHFYFVEAKGSQSIWVVDNPKDYAKWTYDLFAGKTKEELKPLLKKDDEAFGADYRQLMSDALQLARKWSQDIVVKLAPREGDPSAATLACVKRWFHPETAKPEEVKATVTTLVDGFKKICAATNSTSVIFSDRPHKRADASWNGQTYASVNKKDSMNVIYIFKLFLDAGAKDGKGQIGKLWLCALTVIHELSHKLAGAKDIRYDTKGLKPGSGTLTSGEPIKNADTWGYFAADLVGALPAEVFKNVYK